MTRTVASIEDLRILAKRRAPRMLAWCMDRYKQS